MMRKFLIGGNWKMYKGARETEEFINTLKTSKVDISDIDVFIAPPFTSLPVAIELLSNSNYAVGAQNMFWEEEGAYTGEISPVFLKELGVEWVILGHSERRIYFGETDEGVRKKLKTALRLGLNVVICIGETEKEREEGKAEEIVKREIIEALKGAEVDPERIAFAYEPIWAIGTGKTARPEDAEEMHRIIRGSLGNKGEEVRVIYGGSVKPHNAEELLRQDNIDGALIGGASLDPVSFIEIIEAVRRV